MRKMQTKKIDIEEMSLHIRKIHITYPAKKTLAGQEISLPIDCVIQKESKNPFN